MESWSHFKWGCYLTLAGLLVAFSLEVYGLTNITYLNTLISISSSEASIFFLTIQTPSLVAIGIAGYLLLTMKREALTLERTLLLLALETCVITAASLSLSRVVAFAGGILQIVATLRLYLRPTYGFISRSGVAFVAALGSLSTLYSAILYILIWLVFNNFITYSFGTLSNITTMHLSLVVATAVVSCMSGLTALAMRLPKSGMGTVSAILIIEAVTLSPVAWSIFYPLFNLPGYLTLLGQGIGILLLYSAGITALLIAGRSGPSSGPSLTPQQPPISYIPARPAAKFCTQCGSLQKKTDSITCEDCGRSLFSRTYFVFCPYCGHTAPPGSTSCQQCHERFR